MLVQNLRPVSLRTRNSNLIEISFCHDLYKVFSIIRLQQILHMTWQHITEKIVTITIKFWMTTKSNFYLNCDGKLLSETGPLI